ncbi:Domain of unknown function (DUF305) [Seminavis robusta]|uniref:DUF305 domain-containing protein n=1 Tax=Seminavis robusta TaxID=568900 RepID=A0A9N8EIE8_9STRA|nr:Domain of unknown function (DUF305) [Seminavis robusta]|eukprot:Sro1050_g235520.1 Domain of unknown function (DUF305) (716) ;mRNA; f:13505-15652
MMFSRLFFSCFLSFNLLVGTTLVSAHRPATTRASCDEDYGSSATAMPLADPTISWAFKHYLDCTHRAVWIEVTNETPNQPFYVGVGIPTQDRFADVRADALIIGPGLPQLTADEWEQVPLEVRNDPVWNSGSNIGAYFQSSPQDQSTCDHLGTVMRRASRVVGGRCDFYEPFGGSHSWRVLDADDNILVEGNGAAYHVAVFLQQDTSSKLGIALGTWVENFWTRYDIDTPGCNRDMRDYSEKRGSQEECFPVVSCPTAQRPIGCEEVAFDPSQEICEMGEVCDSSLVEPCVTAGVSYEAPTKGACGGELCSAAVQTWEAINAKMHHGMMDIEYTGIPDIDFVRGMIPHHMGAVDMCDGLLQNLTCTVIEETDNLEGLVHFCNHVKLEQEIEVGGMRRWLQLQGLAELASCGSDTGMAGMMRQDPAGDHAMGGDHGMGGDHDHGMGGAMMMPESCGNLTAPSSEKFIEVNHKMHDLMAISYSCDHSTDFVRMMLPHHASAVVMCDILVETSQDEYLIDLCDNITITQRAEIAWMNEWLMARDFAPTAPCHDCSNTDVIPSTNLEVGRAGEIDTHSMSFMPCEDILSTSSFCHGIDGVQDGYCRCDQETFDANGYSCNEATWVDGIGMFVPSVYCKRSCGLCPSGSRPLWAEPEGCELDGAEHMGHMSNALLSTEDKAAEVENGDKLAASGESSGCIGVTSSLLWVLSAVALAFCGV